jgi:hypothetical protein
LYAFPLVPQHAAHTWASFSCDVSSVVEDCTLRCIALRNVVSRPSRRRRNLGSGSKWISDDLIWSSRVGRTNVPWHGVRTHYHCRLFLFFFSSGCIRHRVFSQTGPVYAGVIQTKRALQHPVYPTTVRFQHGHGRCCAALSRLCTGRRGSSSVSFCLSGAERVAWQRRHAWVPVHPSRDVILATNSTLGLPIALHTHTHTHTSNNPRSIAEPLAACSSSVAV